MLGITEAFRNLRANIPLSTAIASICLIAGIGVSITTAFETQRAADSAQNQYLAGATVFEVVSRDSAPLDAVRCHSLMGVEGVLAAGGVMSWESVRIAIEPEADMRLVTTTPRFPGAAWPELASRTTPSIVAGSDLARSGLRDGDSLVVLSGGLPGKTIHVDAVPARAPTINADRLIVATAPPKGTVGSCLVLSRPPAAGYISSVLGDYFDAPANVAARLLPSDLAEDPETLLRTRLSQFGWAALAAVCAIVLLGNWFAHRGNIALYRLLGASEKELLWMLSTECAVVAIVPSQVGLMIGIGAQSLDQVVSTQLLLDIARFDLALLLLPPIALLCIPRKNLVSALKSR